MMFDKLISCDLVSPEVDAVKMVFVDAKTATNSKAVWIPKDEVAGLIKRLTETVPQGPDEIGYTGEEWDSMKRLLKKAQSERDNARKDREEAFLVCRKREKAALSWMETANKFRDENSKLKKQVDAERMSLLICRKRKKEDADWAKMVNRLTDENIRLQMQLDEAEECADVEPLHEVESLLETARVMLAASEKERDELKAELEVVETEWNRYKSEHDGSWKYFRSLRARLGDVAGKTLEDGELLGALDRLVGEREVAWGKVGILSSLLEETKAKLDKANERLVKVANVIYPASAGVLNQGVQ